MEEIGYLILSVTLWIVDLGPLFSHGQNNNTESSDNELSFGVLHTLHNLTSWSNAEENIAEKLRERLTFIEEEARLIKRFLADYAESTGKAMEHLHDKNLGTNEKGRVVGSSFVLGHRMTSRFCSVTKNLRSFLRSEEYASNLKNAQDVLTFIPEELVPNEKIANPEDQANVSNSNLSRKKITGHWPDWEDKYMSLNSLITLNELLGIPPDKMMKGLTLETDYGGHLTFEHFVEVGMFALTRGRYDVAVDWLDMGLQLAQNESIRTIPVDIIHNLLYIAVQEHNKKLWDLTTRNGDVDLSLESDLSIFVHPLTEVHLMTRQMRHSMRQTVYYQNRGLGQEKLSFAQHVDACLGYNRQTPEMQKILKCYYENRRHPYLYINPVKAEVLSKDPPIVQFYEILGSSTIEWLKHISKYDMGLSQLVTVDLTDWDTITAFRTSVGMGLNFEDLPNVYKLAEIVSGLELVKTSDPTQVLEYTYGRHYTFHSDAFTREEYKRQDMEYFGDRLATILYYLEVPKMGGETSFCKAGRSAYPVKGSAILWFNMYRNGTLRNDVEHGACPVIHGHKIVINHWIRYFGNWNHYKCSLNQFE